MCILNPAVVPRGLCDHSIMGSMWPQYHGVYVTTVPWGLCDHSTMGSMWPQSFLTHVFLNCNEYWHSILRIFRKPIRTMSHTFASFCVFPFIFYLCLFLHGVKWTPQYLPCNIDNLFCEFLCRADRNITYSDKQRATDNDTVCKIIRNSHMKCCAILFGFCNPFSVYFSIGFYIFESS
jgi:hypothetical protein